MGMNIGESLWGIRESMEDFCHGCILMLLCKYESSYDYWWPVPNAMASLVSCIYVTCLLASSLTF